jgi:23S rRNA maturation-related 3'-5' exoribonuclease YhaM
MWDYSRVGTYCGDHFSEDLHKKRIHHITRSALIWGEIAKDNRYKDIDEVLHAILAHHGNKEFGSPVSPQTKLAWMLHLCDGISARMNDCK